MGQIKIVTPPCFEIRYEENFNNKSLCAHKRLLSELGKTANTKSTIHEFFEITESFLQAKEKIDDSERESIGHFICEIRTKTLPPFMPTEIPQNAIIREWRYFNIYLSYSNYKHFKETASALSNWLKLDWKFI